MDALYFVMGLILGGAFMWLLDHSWTDDNGEWGFGI